MKLTVNGKEVECPAGTTVAALVNERKLNAACIVVEYNHTILKQNEWEGVVLNQHDTLEIVAFVGGG